MDSSLYRGKSTNLTKNHLTLN